jgi:predicted nucleic acid-binding protein
LKLYVLDASVAIKWVLPEIQEPFSVHAKEVMEQAMSGDLGLVVPDIFWAELGNVIWKAVRKGRIDREGAAKAMEALMSIDVQEMATRSLMPIALETAINSKIAVYDACYVELANRLDIALVTADQSLYLKAAATLPVVWIGAIH